MKEKEKEKKGKKTQERWKKERKNAKVVHFGDAVLSCHSSSHTASSNP